MADDDDDNDDGGYDWVTNGGCERCDSMEGRLYPEPPGRPHPHCDCTIQWVGRGPQSCESNEADITLDHEGSTHPYGPWPSPDDTFEMYFAYRIICPAGDVLEGEIMIERTYQDEQTMDPDDFFDEAYVEAFGEVEDIAASECSPCPEPPGVS
jgi:hypothetical protein